MIEFVRISVPPVDRWRVRLAEWPTNAQQSYTGGWTTGWVEDCANEIIGCTWRPEAYPREIPLRGRGRPANGSYRAKRSRATTLLRSLKRPHSTRLKRSCWGWN